MAIYYVSDVAVEEIPGHAGVPIQDGAAPARRRVLRAVLRRVPGQRVRIPAARSQAQSRPHGTDHEGRLVPRRHISGLQPSEPSDAEVTSTTEDAPPEPVAAPYCLHCLQPASLVSLQREVSAAAPVDQRRVSHYQICGRVLQQFLQGRIGMMRLRPTARHRRMVPTGSPRMPVSRPIELPPWQVADSTSE